jgi:hypothetical protein
VGGLQTLYVADFDTDGLGGPTRADVAGEPRDFIDFVRNIGQPPDKDFGGGSFGYGKAAFYIASRARTVVVDTLCQGHDGRLERRLIACGLGDNFTHDGVPHTGRHWWGRVVDGVPEPMTGSDAEQAADLLGLPDRSGPEDRGTTVMIIAPDVAPEAADGEDHTVAFIVESLIWNFWPRMVDTAEGVKRTMRFTVRDDGRRVSIPDPRAHPRLRGFVEALDRLRQEPGEDADLLLDRSINSVRPARLLGRLVIQKGAVAPSAPPGRAVPTGARLTADGVHHVALMRTPEIVVKYVQGMAPGVGRIGYSGVFKCALDVDAAFKHAEPPTHDDWVPRFVHDRQERSMVKKAMDRVLAVCREAAGYEPGSRGPGTAAGVPLGEFADGLATLMPGWEGPGARRSATGASRTTRRRRHAPGRAAVAVDAAPDGVDGAPPSPPPSGVSAGEVRQRPPQVRDGGDPELGFGADGAPVIRYPFVLRTHGGDVRLSATVEVMTNDGGQVESDAPAGSGLPEVRAWVEPSGVVHAGTAAVAPSGTADGLWKVEVEFQNDVMVRVDITAEIA